MNKIIVDKENKIELDNNIIELEINTNTLEIIVKGKVLINEFAIKGNEQLDLKIYLTKNSTLIYNRFMIHSNISNNITINSQDDSNVVFNYSFMAKDKCNLNVDSILKGNNNNVDVNVKAVAIEKGQCIIKGNAKINEHIKDNILGENIRVLTLNEEEHTIIPNLLVSSNEVEANHAATISSIDPNYMFYLNSKGLSDESAKELVIDGFLISNLDINEELKNKIKELL